MSQNSPTDLLMPDLQCFRKKAQSEICLLGNACMIARGMWQNLLSLDTFLQTQMTQNVQRGLFFETDLASSKQNV